jgi:predicted acylesterase/phospholipase RssA
LCDRARTRWQLVWSAALASCAIPLVYAPVELMAKDENGADPPSRAHACVIALMRPRRQHCPVHGWRREVGGRQRATGVATRGCLRSLAVHRHSPLL